MAKKDFQKRMGQIYALALQQGLTEDELIRYVNESFLFLYSEKRQKEIKCNIDKANYTAVRYNKVSVK